VEAAEPAQSGWQARKKEVMDIGWQHSATGTLLK
jgi:hypothetical protein